MWEFLCILYLCFQCLRVYQLDKHDIKGSQYKQALEWFEVMHSFSIYIISYHISGTVEKFQQVAAESIIDIENPLNMFWKALRIVKRGVFVSVRNRDRSCLETSFYSSCMCGVVGLWAVLSFL